MKTSGREKNELLKLNRIQHSAVTLTWKGDSLDTLGAAGMGSNLGLS